jgi:hypothetical protein
MAIPDPVPAPLSAIRSASRLAPQTSASGSRRSTESFAKRLKPNELISLLTQHYERVRARSRPKVITKIACFMPGGKSAVRIRLG